MHRSVAGSAGIKWTIGVRTGSVGEDPLTCTNVFDTSFFLIGLNEACDATSNKILSQRGSRTAADMQFRETGAGSVSGKYAHE